MPQSTKIQKYFSLEYDTKENLHILSINDNSSHISIGDICKECNDTEVLSKGEKEVIIIHKPIKIRLS